MEAPAQYGPHRERPRLTVVTDGGSQERFSALPHAIIRKKTLSRDARLLVAVLQMYGWNGDDVTASHDTLANDMGCSTRMLRTYLTELIEAGVITEHEAGVRRQKVYRFVSIGTVLPIAEHHNEKPASDSTEVNRKFSTVQSEVFDTFNEKQGSDSYKKTPEKKTLEEDSGERNAANAAPAPAEVKPKAKPESRATRLPADWCLTDDHIQAATKRGFDSARAEAEGEKFADYHRAKGTRMLDWLAAWRTWLGNAVEFDKRRAPSNGTSRTPASQPPKVGPSWAQVAAEAGGAGRRGGPRDKTNGC